MAKTEVRDESRPEIRLTLEQKWVAERFSHMIGDVLTQVDAALPEGAQVENLKRLLSRIMYDARNDFVKTLPSPYGFGE